MEETKRRRFIIRAVLEGEVDVQEEPQPEPSQEEVFGTFTTGKTIGKSMTTEAVVPQYGTYVQNSNYSRACIFAPIENRNYTLTVTDSKLYSVSVYGIVDNTPIPTTYNLAVMHKYFQGDTESASEVSSASSTAPYIMVSLRRKSGSFTAEELAEGATAVFSFTRG